MLVDLYIANRQGHNSQEKIQDLVKNTESFPLKIFVVYGMYICTCIM